MIVEGYKIQMPAYGRAGTRAFSLFKRWLKFRSSGQKLKKGLDKKEGGWGKEFLSALASTSARKAGEAGKQKLYKLAAGAGFEPTSTAPKAAVLPLDDPAR